MQEKKLNTSKGVDRMLCRTIALWVVVLAGVIKKKRAREKSRIWAKQWLLHWQTDS